MRLRNWAQIQVLKMFVPLDVLRGFAYVYSEIIAYKNAGG